MDAQQPSSPPPEEPQPWHRLFGLAWMDLLRDFPVEVVVEQDLSEKKQLLDVAIIRRNVTDPLPDPLPDGFEGLVAHNLVSFKSHQEAFDWWSLAELVAHYVNYRKQAGPSMRDLLPEDQFRLFAVCVRFPTKLTERVTLERVRAGVYDANLFVGAVRVIVVHQLPEADNNAMLHLFSARPESLRFAGQHFRVRSDETSTLLLQLLNRYRAEGMTMPDALQELTRQTIEHLLHTLTPEERLKGLPVEELLKRVPPEERLKGLPVEERLKGLSVDEVLAALPPETRAALAQRFQKPGNTAGTP